MALCPAPDLGPVAERKNRLRTVSARKKASPDRALMPLARPSLSCENEALTEALAFLFASRPRRRIDADVLEPALRACSLASPSWSPMSLASDGDPADHHQEQAHAHADQAEHDEGGAAIGRGMRWRCIQATSGEATAATTAAVITGATIVCVSGASQTEPTRSSATPTRSQAVRPTSRAIPGRRKRRSARWRRSRRSRLRRARAAAGAPWARVSPQPSPDPHPGEPRRRSRAAHHPASGESCGLGVQEARRLRTGDGFRARGDAELAIDGLSLRLHRVLRHEALIGDLAGS